VRVYDEFWFLRLNFGSALNAHIRTLYRERSEEGSTTGTGAGTPSTATTATTPGSASSPSGSSGGSSRGITGSITSLAVALPQLTDTVAYVVAETLSDPFTVYSAKKFPGML
ncbi:hypothetical protein HK104_006555, partial [Borealophlyctis nickersoniae]